MSPLFALLALQAPFVAKDAGLSWRFDGTTKNAKGRYDLVGKDLRGEIHWFVAPKGKYFADELYKSDTLRTKEADEAKGFSHIRLLGARAGLPAIRSDQKYLWKDASVSSRCLYCVKENRAWVVRLWWQTAKLSGSAAADAFLKTIRRL